MTKTKLTPGEWTFSRNTYGQAVVRAEQDGCPFFVHSSGRCDSEEADANARLIAAAKELAEAVRVLLAEVGAAAAEGYTYGPGVGLGNRALAKAGL